MRIDVLMPKLGLTMTQGTVMEWLKKVGDPVSKGEILFTVENDKAVVEVESPGEGILEEIVVPPGGTQEVGKPVAYLSSTAAPTQSPDESYPSGREPRPKEEAQGSFHEAPTKSKTPADRGASAYSATPTKSKIPADRGAPAYRAIPTHREAPGHHQVPGYILASPLVKGLARENRIDLSTVRGTGPEGAVVERDLERLLQQPSSPFPPSRETAPKAASEPAFEPPFPTAAPEVTSAEAATAGRTASTPRGTSTIHTLTPFQIRAAERLAQSWSTIPQFTLWVDVEVNPLEDLHQALKEKGMPVSFTVLLAKFLALTLKQYPLLNASWRGQGAVELYSQIHVGIATDTPQGLFVPVLKDCGTKPLQALQEEWQDLSRRGKEGKLTPSDLAGGTITLTNLGMFGVKRFQAIVNPPQVAILSVGERRRIPREEDTSTFVSLIEFGLSADHRVVDGAYGARFLKSFKEALESPLLTLASIV